MGVLSGSLTYKLFFVQDELPDDWQGSFIDQINYNAFEELDPSDDDDESIGWVHIEHPLQTDFDLKDFKYDHFINLGLRRDRFSIPNALKKAHIAEAEREFRLKHDKDKLSKYEREDIEHMVERRLREKTLPKMRVIDMSWDLRSGRVRFWSHANKVGELFRGLFADTFQMEIMPASPYVNAAELGMAGERVDRLEEIEAANFIDVQE